MVLEMTITQSDNGWILDYLGHNVMRKRIVTTRWARVEKEVKDYFGWYDINGKQTKKPFYDEDNNIEERRLE